MDIPIQLHGPDERPGGATGQPRRPSSDITEDLSPVPAARLDPGALAMDSTPAGAAGVSAGETVVEGPETPSPPSTPWMSAEGPAKAFPGAPVRGWDRYEFVEFLGQGGMGRVYKAYDRRLKRSVALKFILQDNPELARRFLQEAQAQARVEHEHVCKVYEVGEVQGQLYIAMQYVEGRTLKEAAAEMNLEQKLRVVQQVAEGLHAAHRIGLIHRDIKPSNVMVAKTEEGQWVPYVMDFGLARDVQAHGETVTGAVLGTPAYMAPEQALGELHLLDRRTDVYSLGATMYEMLTGRVPFEAPSATALLLKVINDEPLSSRKINPAIPTDLDTIVMKCLEKETHRRYDSARALADDLQRYLDGEPVEARAASWGYKLYKKAKKNKALFAVSGLALVAVIVLGGYGIRSRWLARSQAMLAQKFGLEIKEIEAIMRFAHMAPLHNVRNEMDLLKKRMMGIEEQMEGLGDTGYGPGHYALGRGYLALRKYESAREHLEKAWAAGFQDDSIAMAMGRTMGALYLKQLEQIERITDKDAREAKRKEVENAYREPAIEYLGQVRDVGTESPDYVKGLIAFYQKQYEPALRRARAAREAAVWLYEASILEGDVYRAMGSEKQDRGDYDGARAEYDRAEAAYQQAALVAESDPEVYQQLCALYATTMRMDLWETGSDLWPDFESLLRADEKGRTTDPKDPENPARLAEGYCLWGEYVMGRYGDEALLELAKAVDAANMSIALQPKNPEAYTWMGVSLGLRGVIEKVTGVDPRGTLNSAIGCFSKALSFDPGQMPAYRGMGIAYLDIGEWQSASGLDPRPAFRAAIEVYSKVLSLNPRYAVAHNNMGIIYGRIAQYEMAHGIDPTNSLGLAVAAYNRALEINPNHSYALNNLGSTYVLWARDGLEHGQDPSENIDRAVSLLDRAAGLHADHALAYLNLGEAFTVLAERELALGRDPGQFLSKAQSNFDQAFKLGDYPEACGSVAHAYLIAAEFELDHLRSPLRALDGADAVLEQGAKANPTASDIKRFLGDARLLKARWRMQRRLSPEDEFAAAEAFIGQAIKLNPLDAENYLSLATHWRWRADYLHAKGRGFEEAVRAGLAQVDRSLEINCRAASGFMIRGVLHLLDARAARSQEGQERAVQQAREAFASALALNSNLRLECDVYLQELSGIPSRRR